MRLFPFDFCESLDSSLIITKNNGNKLVECYNKQTLFIKSRTQFRSNSRWNTIVRKKIWDENGKLWETFIYREKYISYEISESVPGRNSNLKEIESVTWHFVKKGKLCFKRKKETRTMTYVD